MNRLWRREFASGFQAQLAAGGVNVASLFPAECGCDPLFFQRGKECFLRGFRRPLPCQVFHLIIGNQINLGAQPAGQLRQWLDLVQRVIDPGDQNIFQRDHAILLLLVIFASRHEFGERIFAVDGHDFVARFIGRAVEGNGDAELLRFIGEFADLILKRKLEP